MNEFFARYKKVILAGIVLIVIAIIVGVYALGGTPANQNMNGSSIPINANAAVVKNTTNDTIGKNLPLLYLENTPIKTETVQLGQPIKSNNGMPDQYMGFDTKIESLNTEGYDTSEYKIKNPNPKNIQGVYFIRYIQGVPTLFHIPAGKDILEQVDIKLPPDSAKHKLLGKKYFGYISDVDVEQIGKSLSLINLENKEITKIPIPVMEMRIASFFMNREETKVVMAAEYPPTSAENFATSDTLHHKVWTFDVPNWQGSEKLIFNQEEDVNERWPFFWSPVDNKIYFNNCDVRAFECNFGITKTSPASDDRTPVEGLEPYTYASQPVPSSDGRRLAYTAWNGNKETPLYKEGEDINNATFNKNEIWVYDIETKTKIMIMDFGDTTIVDHLFWAPDGMKIFFELRRLVQNMPTTNSTGIWYINVITREYGRISPDVTKNPGWILSHFSPSADGSGLTFTITKMFPKNTFNDPSREFEKIDYYLRLSDMKLMELGDNVTGIVKTDAL